MKETSKHQGSIQPLSWVNKYLKRNKVKERKEKVVKNPKTQEEEEEERKGKKKRGISDARGC